MSHDDPHGTDEELAAAMEAITGEGGEFHHREHVHLTFWAVRRYGMPDAAERICRLIRGIAVYHRAPQKYHQTVSLAWTGLVAHHVAEDPACADFEAFASAYPALLDKRLLSRHYRSSTLASQPARRGWVAPDLIPLPGHDLGGRQKNSS
jgi:hypothetical protein